MLRIFHNALVSRCRCSIHHRHPIVKELVVPSCTSDYTIAEKQLEYLAERVRKLQRLTKRISIAKIESFV